MYANHGYKARRTGIPMLGQARSGKGGPWFQLTFKTKILVHMLFQKVQHINPTPGTSPGDTAGLTAAILIKGWDSRSQYSFGLNYFASVLIIF